jgi:hypothetical protein
MEAEVAAQVESRQHGASARHEGSREVALPRGEAVDAPPVVAVRVRVEQPGGAEGFPDRPDRLAVATLADVRDGHQKGPIDHE